MRYAIISDLHANLEASVGVLESIDKLGVDQIVCLGDVVGYNGNPNECADLIREMDIPAICGNHDAVACGLEEPWGFNPVALSAALWTREQLSPENTEWLRSQPDSRHIGELLFVHGSPTNRDLYMFGWDDVLRQVPFLENSPYVICFFGHTHTPGIYSGDGVYTVDESARFALGKDQSARDKRFFINPGSVGQPRDGDPRASFGLLDTGENYYEHIRLEYPIERAANQIVNKGLPQFLAERLFVGR